MNSETFSRVALIGRPDKPDVDSLIIMLRDYLQARQVEVVLEAETGNTLGDIHLQRINKNRLKEFSDLLIVIGGDGSLLTAARIAVDQYLPVLGINRGRLGFLTDIHPTELTKIDKILQGHYKVEQRILLTTAVNQSHSRTWTSDALNDVVLLPGAARMIEFEVYIDEQFVYVLRADGLIIATPTGSTAYALSGGGPIIHPLLNAMVLVPMFPHTLSTRPIVIDANSRVDLYITKNNDIKPYLSCDGHERVHLELGTTISIKQKHEKLKLIHPMDYNYYETLRAKLNWQKSN